MKLGVIGEPCIDYIQRDGTKANKQLGGILYSTVSLAIIAGKSDEVYPIFNLGEDKYYSIILFLSKFKNIKFDYVYKCKHKTRIVKLIYKSGSSTPDCLSARGSEQVCVENNDKQTYDREESSTEPTLPLGFEQVKPSLEMVDGLLINMVSGIDITLETLSSIRQKFKGYIHMDLHNVVMKTEKDGGRHRAPIDNWLDWCCNCDTLQMNEAEILVLSGGEGLNEYETAEKILKTKKVKSVVVTRGNQGVSMYMPENKSFSGEKYFELDKIDLPPIEIKHFKDSTGCGDVLGSAFFYKSLNNNLTNIPVSLNYANKLASRNAELMGVEEMEKLIG